MISFPFNRGGFWHELLEQSWPMCFFARSKKCQRVHYEVAILQQTADGDRQAGRSQVTGCIILQANSRAGLTGHIAISPKFVTSILNNFKNRGVKSTGNINIADRYSNGPQDERNGSP